MALPLLKLVILSGFLLFLAGAPFADFSMRSLTVFANINRDGSVNVEERLVMAINGTPSKELYEATRSAYSDLATWKARTALLEMRHHVSRANAQISDLRLTPQSIDYCNAYLATCFATMTLNYVVPADQNGSGLVKVERYKPRTARYSLVQDALSFEQTKTGDLVIPPGTIISIAIPQAAENIYFSTPPENLKEQEISNFHLYGGEKRTFSWQGNTLSTFQFTYEIESSLESEVLGFFRDSQKAIVGFFTGVQGLAALILLAAAALSVYQFNRISHAQQ